MAFQLRLQRSDQIARLPVDRALPLEVVVMLGDRQQPLLRNIASAQHGFEKGNHILFRLRASKRNHQNSVVVHAGIIVDLTIALVAILQ